MSAQQKGRSLEVYYDEVNRLLSLIANQIKMDDRFIHPEASKALIDTYNKKAVDAFIRGLDGEIYRFIRNYEPKSLAGAYSYCIEFQNVECRKLLTKPRQIEPTATPRNLIPMMAPKLPPRPMQQAIQGRHHIQPRPSPPFNNNFIKPPVFRNHYQFPPPQHNRQSMQQPRIPPKNPFLPPPEPMEVDPSLRTNRINYGNRPQQNPLKRPRLFNTETGQYEEPPNDASIDLRADYYPSEDEEYYPEETSTYERYIRQVEAQDRENHEEAENAELNFLV